MSWLDTINITFVKNILINYFGETSFDIFDVFPRLPVKLDAGKIAGYDKETLLDIGNVDDYNIMGAVEAPEISKKAVHVDYSCVRKSAKILVTRDDVQNSSSPYAAIKDNAAILRDTLGRILIKSFVQKTFNTSVWNTVKSGGTTTAADFVAWNQSTSNPRQDVDNFNTNDMLAKTGYSINTMVVTQDVFVALKHNAAIKDVLKVTDDKVVNEARLASLFGVKKFLVARTIDSDGFLITNTALLLYTTDTPSTKAPSAGYIAVSGGTGPKRNHYVQTRTYKQPEKNEALAIEGSFKIDPVITCPDLGILLTNVLA